VRCVSNICQVWGLFLQRLLDRRVAGVQAELRIYVSNATFLAAQIINQIPWKLAEILVHKTQRLIKGQQCQRRGTFHSIEEVKGFAPRGEVGRMTTDCVRATHLDFSMASFGGIEI